MLTDQSAREIWSQALALLGGKISKEEVGRWLKPLRLECELTGGPARLIAPNRFYVDWVNERYHEAVREALSVALRRQVEIRVCTDDDQTNRPNSLASALAAREARAQTEAASSAIGSSFDEPPADPDSTPGAAKEPLSDGLGARYTFERFVVGSSNQFAYAAAQAVANLPGQTYNPLFIYGGAGLGKTHLMNAVGNHIKNKNGRAVVVYVSSEDFTNQMIQAIRNKTMDAFRARYRSVDVLLIDDIHFLGSKERTQEEFFFTFNALYDTSKQIVLTSDQRPKDIPGLEERLRSRFEWGLIADIQVPDRETKVAIIQKKAEDEGIAIPEDVAYLLASNDESNVRVLEGYLVRLAAYSSITGQPISMELTKQVLHDSLMTREITVDDIMRRVGERFNVSLADLKSGKKEKKIAEPRQIAMFLARKLTNLPLVKIGQKFGGKDHSTVVHAVKKIQGRIDKNFDFRQEMINLEKVIRRG